MKSFGAKPEPTEDIVEIDTKKVSYTCIYRTFRLVGLHKLHAMIHSRPGKAKARSIFPTASDLHFYRDLTELRRLSSAFDYITKKPPVVTAQCANTMTLRQDAISVPSG